MIFHEHPPGDHLGISQTTSVNSNQVQELRATHHIITQPKMTNTQALCWTASHADSEDGWRAPEILWTHSPIGGPPSLMMGFFTSQIFWSASQIWLYATCSNSMNEGMALQVRQDDLMMPDAAKECDSPNKQTILLRNMGHTSVRNKDQ